MIEETWNWRVSKLNWSSMYEVGIYWTALFGESSICRIRYRSTGDIVPIDVYDNENKMHRHIFLRITWNNEYRWFLPTQNYSINRCKKIPVSTPFPLLLQPHINGQVEREENSTGKIEGNHEATPKGWVDRRLMDQPLVVKSWLQSNGREKGGGEDGRVGAGRKLIVREVTFEERKRREINEGWRWWIA